MPSLLRRGPDRGHGPQLRCHACGKVWELDEYGLLRAREGETEFAHIPHWYAWERQQVKRELEDGSYLLDIPVEIGMLVDFKAVYMIGEGRLRHDLTGFTWTAPRASFTLFARRNSPTASMPTTTGTSWGTSSASGTRRPSTTASRPAAHPRSQGQTCHRGAVQAPAGRQKKEKGRVIFLFPGTTSPGGIGGA